MWPLANILKRTATVFSSSVRRFPQSEKNFPFPSKFPDHICLVHRRIICLHNNVSSSAEEQITGEKGDGKALSDILTQVCAVDLCIVLGFSVIILRISKSLKRKASQKPTLPQCLYPHQPWVEC